MRPSLPTPNRPRPSVAETRFFRHQRQIGLLQGRVLPERLACARREARPLRLWSAGCATGEEAWTLALLLLQLRCGPAEAEVLGTDRAPEHLQAARAGRYPESAVSRVPLPLRRRYLRSHGDQEEVTAEARSRVRFRLHDLLGPRYPQGFDVILCRNVLIYYEEVQRRPVLGRLRDSLREGGYLFLGPAEALPSDLEGFEVLRCPQQDGPDDLLYRRPPAPSLPPPEADARTPWLLRLSGSYGDGERLQRELRQQLSGTGGAVLALDLDGASFLGDGDARVLRRAREAFGLRLVANKRQVQRWLQRHALLPAPESEEGG